MQNDTSCFSCLSCNKILYKLQITISPKLSPNNEI